MTVRYNADDTMFDGGGGGAAVGVSLPVAGAAPIVNQGVTDPSILRLWANAAAVPVPVLRVAPPVTDAPAPKPVNLAPVPGAPVAPVVAVTLTAEPMPAQAAPSSPASGCSGCGQVQGTGASLQLAPQAVAPAGGMQLTGAGAPAQGVASAGLVDGLSGFLWLGIIIGAVVLALRGRK